METDQCMDTQEDILTIILDEVRSMRVAFDQRLAKLERTMGLVSHDLREADASIRVLVNAYQNQNQQLALQKQMRLPLRDGAPTPTPPPLSVVASGKGDDDA